MMTSSSIGATRDEGLERARQLYARSPREADFDTWFEGYAQRAVVGSVEDAVARLREYEAAGCDGVMLQNLLHTDLEPVRLIGRELAPALA
jgi:alkanesulfonate monooxygenase SsuD/methylene tetrahydromethanopterin reductase-like flavin-dependent oxidoreductase (luciferase family)